MQLQFLLLYFFLFVVVVQLFFYGFIFGKFAFFKPKQLNPKNLSVSVILCAKDEEDNLRSFLPFIINQNYPNFEIVLINDRSCDGTLSVMEEFKDLHPNIKIVDVKPNERFHGNKKYALTLGIKAATHDFLLLTDADCRPSSSLWISEMSRHFSREHTIILGYGAYKKVRNSFLNKLIRYETLLTASQYFSMALHHSPYMGVGRNLAYRKGLFINNNGFNSHIKLRSGDDDLLIHKIADSKNTVLSLSKTSFTISEPKGSFKEWVIQKRRHISTSKYYSAKLKLVLGLFFFSQFFFFLLGFYLIWAKIQLGAVVILILLRMLTHLFVMKKISNKLDESDLLLYMPILEITIIAFQFYIFIFNLLSQPKHWN